MAGTAVPFLPRGVRVRHCEIRQAWFLLAPERAVRLEGPSAAILSALDGVRSLSALVDHLAAQFNADRAQIDRDVRAFLAEMAHRRFVEFRS